MKALRNIPAGSGYKKGDVMVVFGELFAKGYANGIVEEATKLGMTVVRSTVGRRTSDGELRALNEEEAAQHPAPFINIPLEAGFDMEPDANGTTPCAQLKGLKLNEWDKPVLDWDSIEQSKEAAITRFRSHVTNYMNELKQHIPDGANVLFVHTMAGGVPRAKILMPAMNKVFKGRGDRYVPSEKFWNSDLGKLCNLNFNEVTAYTFKHLVELSSEIRQSVTSGGGKCSYVAYGYHGTEIMLGGEYTWQTYTPYVQGWAKMELENLCESFTKEGVPCSVYNCPEILTNSSSIFQGVEVSLYPLLGAVEKEGANSSYCQKVVADCKKKIKPEHTVDEIMTFTTNYVKDERIARHNDLNNWPGHNTQDQMEFMLDSSNHLISMHEDKKDLITFLLSEEVFKACGQLMLHDSWDMLAPVTWLNHDVIAKQMAQQP